MIKNLAPYKNKWARKYYWVSNGIIFNIDQNNDSDGCGIQPISDELKDFSDELGRFAVKSCGITIKFKEHESPLYFPLQYLIGEGDLINTAKHFILNHPTEFTKNGFYLSKFFKSIDDELISMIASGKSLEYVKKALPAWLTTPNDTPNISIQHFIQGELRQYTGENIPSGIEVGTLERVGFNYYTKSDLGYEIAINTYDETFLKNLFKSQIAASGIDLINSRLKKQLNSQLLTTAEDAISKAINVTEITESTPAPTNQQLVIVHNNSGVTIMNQTAYDKSLNPST